MEFPLHSNQNRLPKLYSRSTKILKAVKTEGKSLNNTLYSTDNAHVGIKRCAGLVSKALQHSSELDVMYKFIKNKYKGVANFDEHKVCILITELLWGKGFLPDKDHDILKLINEYQDNLIAMKDTTSTEEKLPVVLPRYVRINTLKTTENYVLTYLENEGWVKQANGKSYSSYLKFVAQLEEPNFMRDFHYPEILVFPPQTSLYDHPLCLDNLLVLQAKSTCVPVKLLNPNPGSIVLDMCAAPGMKTSQLAAHMNDIGVIHAVEQDTQRYNTLQQILKNTGVTCAKTYNNDVLSIQPEHFLDVTHILVDPSCSGSGMNRIEMTAKTEEQVQNLAKFQFRVLCKALSFPGVRRIVYSTCSIYEVENEAVVTEALAYHENNFKLVDAWPGDSNGHFTRGSSNYPGGELSIYILPEKDLSTGFFVAVIEKISKKKRSKDKNKFGTSMEQDLEVPDHNGSKISDEWTCNGVLDNEKKKKRHPIAVEEVANRNLCEIGESEADVEPEDEAITFKKRKKKHTEDNTNNSLYETETIRKELGESEEDIDLEEDEIMFKKKKKKAKIIEKNNTNLDLNESESVRKEHKKTKKKIHQKNTEENFINNSNTKHESPVKSHKKSKKDRNRHNEQDPSNAEEVCESDTLKKDKKKKKKSSKTTLGDSNTNEEKKSKRRLRLEAGDEDNESTVQEDRPSKKKSHDKGKENNSTSSQCLFELPDKNLKGKRKMKNESSIIEDNTEEMCDLDILKKCKRKKKKSSKTPLEDSNTNDKNKSKGKLRLEADGEDNESTEQEDCSLKKKKKKKHDKGKENHSTTSQCLLELPDININAKSKMKNKSLMTEDNTEEICESDELKKGKRKKKKSSKTPLEDLNTNDEKKSKRKLRLEAGDEDDESTVQEDCPSKKKKKKKHDKDKENNSTSSQCLLEFPDTNSKAKRKMKKKSLMTEDNTEEICESDKLKKDKRKKKKSSKTTLEDTNTYEENKSKRKLRLKVDDEDDESILQEDCPAKKKKKKSRDKDKENDLLAVNEDASDYVPELHSTDLNKRKKKKSSVIADICEDNIEVQLFLKKKKKSKDE